MKKVKKQKTKNEEKNEIQMPQGVEFSSTNQPTPEAKSAGWQRKKKAQELMDKIKSYSEMKYKDFSDMLNNIKNNPDKYSVEEVFIANYVAKITKNDKFLLDYLDRNISKAPVDLGLDTGNQTIKLIIGNDTDRNT